jgi:small GTP-binding protein
LRKGNYPCDAAADFKTLCAETKRRRNFALARMHLAKAQTRSVWRLGFGVKQGPGEASKRQTGLLARSNTHPSCPIAGADKTVRVWDLENSRGSHVLEGHTDKVVAVSFSFDGKVLASRSVNGEIALWSPKTGLCLGKGSIESPQKRHLTRLAFHPAFLTLATPLEDRAHVALWRVDTSSVSGPESRSDGEYYRNAKVVLLGDSGVGKTALGLALTGHHFQPTESTHGYQLWILDNKEIELPDGTRETRETILWDLAGQPGYRLTHQLFLNEVSAALVVFDSKVETDPFSGVRYWDRALRQARRFQGHQAARMKKILVAARTDRGAIAVNAAKIRSFVTDLGFDLFVETSCKENIGISELAQAIRDSIEWNDLPKITSPVLFHQIKRFLSKENRVRSNTLDRK